MSRPAIRIAHPHIRCEPSKFGGSPYIVGSGVLVRRIWAWHRGGTSLETLIRRYPQLGPAKILDALAFAWDNTDLIEDDLAREQRLLAKEKGKSGQVGLRPMSQQILPFNGDSPDDDKEGQER
jgi:uncharacterized protein (DUF433 family)